MQFSDKKEHAGSNNGKVLITREDAQVYSYEIRSKLNALVGSLRLLYDGLIDDPVEEKELLEESCDSATQLIETLQYFEKAK